MKSNPVPLEHFVGAAGSSGPDLMRGASAGEPANSIMGAILWFASLLTSAAAVPSERFEVRSGTVEFVIQTRASEVPRQSFTQVLYFDDFGAKRATMTRFADTKRKMENWQIFADGWEIRYSAIGRTGARKRIGDRGVHWVSPFGDSDRDKALAEEKKRTLKELPAKEIAGRTCGGQEYTSRGRTVREWTWKGLTLEKEEKIPIIDGNGTTTSLQTATKVDVETPVPPERFAAPADIRWETADF